MTCEEKMSHLLAEVTSWNSSVQKRQHFIWDINYHTYTHTSQLRFTTHHMVTLKRSFYDSVQFYIYICIYKWPWCGSNSPPSSPPPCLESSWVQLLVPLAQHSKVAKCQHERLRLILWANHAVCTMAALSISALKAFSYQRHRKRLWWWKVWVLYYSLHGGAALWWIFM